MLSGEPSSADRKRLHVCSTLNRQSAGRSEPTQRAPASAMSAPSRNHAHDGGASVESEAAQLREAEIAKARSAAEADAGEKLAVELAKVRGEAEQKMAKELERVRAEAELSMAERFGQSMAAADQARTDQLAALRAAALKEARAAAEQASARTLEEEVARVRAETESRLGAELTQVEEQASNAASAAGGATAAETLREQAAREVHSTAQRPPLAHRVEAAVFERKLKRAFTGNRTCSG